VVIPFAKSLRCPVLIGRSHYLEVLHEFVEQAKNKIGHTVLISGEAGIGKSRLVAEAKIEADDQGFRVLQGNCFQPDTVYPYAPLLDLLHPYFTDDQSIENNAKWVSIAQELSHLLPELVSLTPSSDVLPTSEANQNKRRLFIVLFQIFSYWASQQPLLVVIEDLHWSDETSLEFLYQLAGGVKHALSSCLLPIAMMKLNGLYDIG
jgi:predicted ATPase